MRDVSSDAQQRETRAASRVADLAAHLRQAIDDAGLSLREVEDRIGMGRDYLSQLLRGSVDLKLKHVYLILDAVGIEDPAQIGLAVPPRDRDQAVERELERTKRLFASRELAELIDGRIRAQMEPVWQELRRPNRG